MPAEPCPPALVDVVRNGIVESVHRGYATVVDADGRARLALGGDPVIYPRSAVKPFQALAVIDLLAKRGQDLTPQGLAIACASHTGANDHLVESAQLLAIAGLDESALRCPPTLPLDASALRTADAPVSLAYNCSGKHAAFLLAQVAAGEDPDRYLTLDSAVQRRVVERIAEVTGAEPAGPGVDGCGAPAWRLPLSAVARGFARLASATSGPLAAVLSAMQSRPDLVGGAGMAETELMLADGRVVAKRGAEGVLAAGGTDLVGGTVGVAVKVADGGPRAALPVVATLLRDAGARMPDRLLAPPVLGGGKPQGALTVQPLGALPG